MKVYGIPNCNTVKKSLDWLKQHKVEIEFHDFKKLGVSAAQLKRWIDLVGWEALVNKKGTTWRMLDAETQASITSEKKAIALMIEKTSVIKRPIIEVGNTIILGFDEAQYSKQIKKK
jgi:arsenate reductase